MSSVYTQRTSIMFAILKGIAAFNRQYAISRNIRQKAKIAEVFNQRYTYRTRLIENSPLLPSSELGNGSAPSAYSPKGGYAWMCPDCNKVHMAVSWNGLTGIEYPPCCRTLDKSPRYID